MQDAEMTPGSPPWTRVDALGLAIMAVLALPFSLSALVLPWGRDQGIYATSAWWFLEGRMPYSEIFIFKPPGTVFVHAISQLLFGQEMIAIRGFDVFWTLTTASLLFWIARRATGSTWAAVVAGVFYAWRMCNYDYWTHAQTDGFANLFYALSLVLVLWNPGDRWRLVSAFASGLALAGAFWLKYTTGGLLVFLVVVPILLHGWRAWAASLAVIGGFVSAGAAICGWLWLGGGWDEFWTIQTEVVFPYTAAAGTPEADQKVQRKSIEALWTGFQRFQWMTMGPWALGALTVLGWLGAKAPRLRREGLNAQDLAQLGALVMALSGLLSTYVQGKYFTYHYHPIIGGGSLLGAIGLWTLGQLVRGRWPIVFALGFLVLLAQGRFPNRWRIVGEWLTGEITAEGMVAQGNYEKRRHGVALNQSVGAWLESHVPPDETVYHWGYDPMIYTLAHRLPATRFPYHYPQVVAWAPPRYRTELLETLHADPPAAIVVGTGDMVRSVGVPGDSYALLRRWDALNRFVEDNYTQQKAIGRFLIWTRNDLDVDR